MKHKNNKTGKNNKKNIQKATDFKPTYPLHWYYMATKEISVKQLQEALNDTSYETEIWEAAGVLEVEIAEKASMDFEECEPDLRDEYSNDFLKEHGVQALFFVTLPKTDFEALKKVMEQIVEKNGGFFCGDTEDFTPMIGI